jgi:hypothetical protein
MFFLALAGGQSRAKTACGAASPAAYRAATSATDDSATTTIGSIAQAIGDVDPGNRHTMG